MGAAPKKTSATVVPPPRFAGARPFSSLLPWSLADPKRPEHVECRRRTGHAPYAHPLPGDLAAHIPDGIGLRQVRDHRAANLQRHVLVLIAAQGEAIARQLK